MSAANITVYVLIFISVILIVWAVRNMIGDSPEKTENSRLPAVYRIFSAGIAFFSEELGTLLESLLPKLSGRIREALNVADYPMEVKDIYGASLFFLFAGAFLGVVTSLLLPAVDMRVKVSVIGLVCAIGLFFPVMHLQKVAEQRRDEILHVLPFAIDLVCSSMKAGLDFGSAVRYLLATGEEDVLRREFAVFLRDVELGKTRSDALKDMRSRINLPEFDRFVTAITYGMDSGSSIIEIMRIQAEEMRRVKFTRAEQQAAKAPAKMIIPMVIFIFPSMFFIIFVPIILKFFAK